MNEEEELVAATLGIDMRYIFERYKRDPVVKTLLKFCVEQTRKVIQLERNLYININKPGGKKR